MSFIVISIISDAHLYIRDVLPSARRDLTWTT